MKEVDMPSLPSVVGKDQSADEASRYDAPPVFVFGSNLAGRHGKGAALHARQHHGAIYGQGKGFQGSSYAIPTKDERLRTLPLHRIAFYVEEFLNFAYWSPHRIFQVTRIGCGLAGYRDEQIAPMFAGAPSNCLMPDEWRGFIAPHSGSPQTPGALRASSSAASDVTKNPLPEQGE